MGLCIDDRVNKKVSVELRRESFKIHREDTGYGEQHAELEHDDIDALIRLLLILRAKLKGEITD